MAHDAELDRLKATRDLAFNTKQTAWEKQNQAWQVRNQAREALSRAYDEKQNAYNTMDSAWQTCQGVHARNDSRIDSLKTQQESAFQNMKSAFDSASAAHERRDGASAKSYSLSGHSYKAEAQRCTAERRTLVAECKLAGERVTATKPAFERAKAEFASAKQAHERAKATHEAAQAEFKQAKTRFEEASKAFKNRLEMVRNESKKRQQDKRQIAEKAGVPYQYLDNVWVSTDASGNINIYFGGVGTPDGLGHGHYAVDRQGKVIYRREPFDPHGAQNFQHEERVERELARIALDAWARRQTTSWEVQSQASDCTVKVKSGYSRDRNAVTTDVVVFQNHNSGEHYHLVIDDIGSVVFSEWRKNH
jgi:hypothetical protein